MGPFPVRASSTCLPSDKKGKSLLEGPIAHRYYTQKSLANGTKESLLERSVKEEISKATTILNLLLDTLNFVYFKI